MTLKSRLSAGLAGIVAATAMAGPAEAKEVNHDGYEVPNLETSERTKTFQYKRDGTDILIRNHKTEDGTEFSQLVTKDAKVNFGYRMDNFSYVLIDSNCDGVFEEKYDKSDSSWKVPECAKQVTYNVPALEGAKFLGQKATKLKAADKSEVEVTLKAYSNDEHDRFTTVTTNNKNQTFAYSIRGPNIVLLDSDCDGTFDQKFTEKQGWDVPECAYK